METLQRTANRGSVSTGYDIANSLKLEDANFEHITKNYSGDGDMRTWTYSTWVKKCKFGSANFDYMYMFAGQNTSIHFLNNGILRVALYNGSSTVYADIDRLFRDGSAWYHIIVVLDTTQSTAADRVKIYINGVRETVFDNSTYTSMSQNEEFTIGQASANYQVGYFYAGGGSNYGFSGYMAETHYVNGTALDETSFGEFDDDSGIWKPKEYTGSHGSKGFYLKFDDSSNLGKDSASSGIGDFTVSNITAADQATDTPTNNFATLNVLNRNSASSGVTNNSIFTEGNTKITGNLNAYWQSGVSTIGITSGKWYFEARPFDSDTKICTIGYGDEADIENWGRNNDFPGAASSKSYGYAGGTASGYGQIIPSTNKPSPAVTYNQTNIIGVAIDADNGYVYWSKDGSYVNSGNPASGASGTGGIAIPTGAGTNGTLFPAVGFYYDSTVPIMLVNFGGYTTISISSAASDDNGYGTFEYAPPSGYFAICTKNLAEHG